MPIIGGDLSFIFIVLQPKQSWNESDVYHFRSLLRRSATIFHRWLEHKFYLLVEAKDEVHLPFMSNGQPHQNPENPCNEETLPQFYETSKVLVYWFFVKRLMCHYLQGPLKGKTHKNCGIEYKCLNQFFSKCDIPVPGIFLFFRQYRNWYWKSTRKFGPKKKYRNRYRKNLVTKKVPETVRKNLVQKKVQKPVPEKIWYQK